MNQPVFNKGSYGYDLEFMNRYQKPVILSDSAGAASVMIIPGWQARVMTSTANGPEGFSYGWINYDLISSGKKAEHINAFGGEERLWLGPEGGPFSLYFAPEKEQIFDNWYVPPVLDTEAFELTGRSTSEASFTRNSRLVNYSGTQFDIRIDRRIKLLSKEAIGSFAGIQDGANVSAVAYETENRVTNTGKEAWTEKGGALSIWMLSMLTPSPGVTVFIPYNQKNSAVPVVNDDYFGKVPQDRLMVKDGIIWFKADGKYRSKIGVAPERALEICGSYDASNKALTILWCRLPDSPSRYVNSKWGEQKNPYQGDVINSYNDGPVEDGSQMGPFYELESSSPAAFLKPGESMVHTQRIYHIEGDEETLSSITQKIFGISIEQIKSALNK